MKSTVNSSIKQYLYFPYFYKWLAYNSWNLFHFYNSKECKKEQEKKSIDKGIGIGSETTDKKKGLISSVILTFSRRRRKMKWKYCKSWIITIPICLSKRTTTTCFCSWSRREDSKHRPTWNHYNRQCSWDNDKQVANKSWTISRTKVTTPSAAYPQTNNTSKSTPVQ